MPGIRSDKDYDHPLLAGNPCELACAVADFRPAIGATLDMVGARDPLEQPLTLLLRLHATHAQAVGTTVAVNDMREYEPQIESPAQTSRDCNRLGGAGGLVDSAHDGFHHRPLRSLREPSIGDALPRRHRG
jgi:hypothetical protein